MLSELTPVPASHVPASLSLPAMRQVTPLQKWLSHWGAFTVLIPRDDDLGELGGLARSIMYLNPVSTAS